MTRPLSLAPSSWISSARYDDEKNELQIDFIDGGSGTWFGVPPMIAGALEHTPSPGRFVRRHMSRYRFEGG